MPRYGRVPKRKIPKDPVCGSELIQRFINKIMYDGKKSIAEAIVYSALAQVETKSGKKPNEIFEAVLKNLSPLMEVKSRRVGGATYQVPIEVSKERGHALAIKWLREAARDRSGRSMEEKLAAELLDIMNNVGAAMKKREDMHKTAEANKAFAHFRW